MKGAILAGGRGTRLYPLTASTNKHLIPVGNLPMIEYPLHTLRVAGIDEISVVSGGENLLDVAKYLGTVHKSINFAYHYQQEAGGIAQALNVARSSLHGEKIAVILGDNIFEEDFRDAAKKFEESQLGAMLFLKPVPDSDLYSGNPNEIRRARYGIAEIEGDRIISLEEKPTNPKSNLAVVGLYFYDNSIFEKIKGLKRSERGEYEITDANKLYLEEGRLGYHLIQGFWSDAGTFPSRKVCESFVGTGLESKILDSIASSENDDLLEKNLMDKSS